MIEKALLSNRDADLEEFLKTDERLHLQAAGPGSWWLTVLTKVGGAGQKALDTVSLVYAEGRDLFMRRVRAGTVVKELEAEEKKFQLQQQRVLAYIDIANRIEDMKNPEARAIARERFIADTRGVNPDIAGLLPPSRH